MTSLRGSRNPAIPMVKVKDQCRECGAAVGFRFSRYKMVEGKRVAVFVCQKCGAER